MKVLVLGSDGQIGSALVKYFRDKHEVIGFDIFSNPENDLRVPDILDLSGIDFVFFLAFDVGGSVYLKKYQDTYKFISNNVRIMNNTFASLREFQTPFIFTSSQMAGMNNSSYGSLKRIGEYYTSCLNGKTVRLWNVYGEQNCSEKSFVITDFISMARSLNRINMRTNGEEKRQFLYVEDCCKCFEILMNNEIKDKCFDVSSFHWITIKEVADIVSSNFNNCKVFSGYESDDVQRENVKEPSNDIFRYWKPETSIEEGIKKLIG